MINKLCKDTVTLYKYTDEVAGCARYSRTVVEHVYVKHNRTRGRSTSGDVVIDKVTLHAYDNLVDKAVFDGLKLDDIIVLGSCSYTIPAKTSRDLEADFECYRVTGINYLGSHTPRVARHWEIGGA